VDDRNAREILARFGTLVDQFGVCFNRRPQRETARRHLYGLFNDSERFMQAIHGRLSDPTPYQALQHFVTDSLWEADAIWTRLRARLDALRGPHRHRVHASPDRTPAERERRRRASGVDSTDEADAGETGGRLSKAA